MHLLAPIGWIFFAAQFTPGNWLGALLGLVALIFAHEVGHAVLVRANGAWVQSIDFLLLGGECSWQGTVTPLGQSVIAWGGVLGQALVLGVVHGVLSLTGQPSDPFFVALVFVLTVSNVWMIGLNLLPFQPLDGSRAWLLMPRALARLRKPHRLEDVRSSQAASPWQRLVSKFKRRKLRVLPPPEDRKYLN